jgi:hypothetical protein
MPCRCPGLSAAQHRALHFAADPLSAAIGAVGFVELLLALAPVALRPTAAAGSLLLLVVLLVEERLHHRPTA